ncbi:MAG: dUTP diphosphatase [bacterium]|nr:dUTP diphosphatase [bacterium]
MDFKSIWENQLGFNSKLVDFNKVQEDKEEFQKWNNFYTLALHREVSEVLDTVNWKIHRKEDKPKIKSNTLEELVDCLKYWMCLCQLHGFSLEDIEKEYYRKSDVVVQRHKQELVEQINTEGCKVVGVDIDGVLADYPRSFVDFINKELGTNYTMDKVTSYDIYDCLGIPTEIGMRIKDRYRQTGQKRFIPVIPGAVEFLQELRNLGYKIMLLTARPYPQYKRIFADTMEWLQKNGLVFDSIIFDKKKEERLVKEFGANKIEFFVDDVASNANTIARLGVPCYLVTRPYNVGVSLREGIIRVNNLEEVIADVRHNCR